MCEGLRSLVIDSWYKALLVLSVGILVIGLTTPLQVSNKAVVLMSFGCVLFSLGQWINHPLQEKVGIGFKISGHPRNAHPGGVGLEIAGGCLIAWGVWVMATA